MLRVSRKASVFISLILAHVCFLLVVGLAVCVPTLLEHLISLPDLIGDRGSITQTGRVAVLVLTYVCLGIVLLADVLLVALLYRVRSGRVFTSFSVALIRAISWCAIALGAIFAVLTYYFTLASIVAFAGIFLGLCLRVVKNVIEEATEIKAENDFTV